VLKILVVFATSDNILALMGYLFEFGGLGLEEMGGKLGQHWVQW
jgi:hypothetical protein